MKTMPTTVNKDLINFALRHSNNGIAVTDAAGIILFWSQGAEKILGVGPDEALNSSLASLRLESLNPGDDLASIQERMTSGNAPLDVITTIQGPQVPHVTVTLNAAPFSMGKEGEEGTGCVFVFKDVSDFKKKETELEKKIYFLEGYLSTINETQKANMKFMREITLRKKEIRGLNSSLKELNQAILRSLENLAHDLLSPLTNIIGFSQMIDDPNALSKEEYLDRIDVIKKSGSKIKSLVTRLMDVTRLEAGIDSGKVALSLTKFDMNQAVRASLEEYRFAISKKGLKARFRPDKEDLEIEADEELISQVLCNLVSNAIKYTPAGGSISLDTEEQGESIRFRITDTGIGIPEKDMPMIFHRFYRVIDPNAPMAGGIGIGLNLVKSIVDLHQGSVTVERGLGQGTTFKLLLPKTQTHRDKGQ